jgi:hypothetical protein
MIQNLEPHFAQTTAELLKTTILESPYYSDLAKTEEIAGLTTEKLLVMPCQNVQIAVEDNTVLGVLVSSTEEAGLLWLSWCVVSPAARGNCRGANRGVSCQCCGSRGA